MLVQVHIFQYFRLYFCVLLTTLGCLNFAQAQALSLRTLESGIQLVHVAQPLAQSTAVSWLDGSVDPPESVLVVGGALTLTAELEEAFRIDEMLPVSPVVVAVGAAAPDELVLLFERLSGARPLLTNTHPAREELIEGVTERRLASPGDEASLRLGLAIPEPSDPRRNSVLVLVEMLPRLLAPQLPGVILRSTKDIFWLEARVDPEMAEVTLRQVRLALARLAQDPQLSLESVTAARGRLVTLRRAELDEAQGAAQVLLELWCAGGEIAVRHYLFGLAGVTFDQVRDAARDWLPEHPGMAMLGLPPRVFSPRFAGPPDERRLGNDMSVAVVERTGSPLAVLCVRPVMLPDVDGDIAATILTRLARQIRANVAAPGWVRIQVRPPLLELAGPPEGFAELCEVLGAALRAMAQDSQSVPLVGEDSRRRALQLMGGHIGLAEGTELTPSALLDPDNLAIGAVVADGEEAWEAFDKFLVAGVSNREGLGRTAMTNGDRFRVRAPGSRSTVIVELPFDSPVGAPVAQVTLRLLAARADLEGLEIELISPLVPGREVLLLLATAEANLDDVEVQVAELWPQLTVATSETELAPLRRETAAQRAAEQSGALGRARLAAAVAAGDRAWLLGTQDEMRVLTVESEEVTAQLEQWRDLAALRVTGAGVLPIRS
ncbi:MAG: hypothetical protein GY906_02380, partial [bacterium]|nr:hypothetical protein [bacterium]